MTLFNELPIHSIYIWGDNLKFIKLADAVPGVRVNKQPPNCLDLQTNHYCAMSATHQVKLVKAIDDFDDTHLSIE